MTHGRAEPPLHASLGRRGRDASRNRWRLPARIRAVLRPLRDLSSRSYVLSDLCGTAYSREVGELGAHDRCNCTRVFETRGLTDAVNDAHLGVGDRVGKVVDRVRRSRVLGTVNE